MNSNPRSLFSCDQFHRTDFPRLEKIDYKVDQNDDRDKKIKTALKKLEWDCNARKITAKAIKEQEAKKRDTELETNRAKLKKKEELQARLKKRQYRKKSNRRVVSRKPKGETFHSLEFTESLDDSLVHSDGNGIVEKRQQRRRKGSDFFDPAGQGDDRMGNDVTPPNPRRLISSFSSQSSGQRVSWADNDSRGNDGYDDFDDDCNERDAESDPKTKNHSDSLDSAHNRKSTSKEIRNTDSSCTKTSTIDTDTKQGRSRPPEDKIGSSKIKKLPGVDARRFRGRQRSRSASKSFRNRSIQRKRSARNLELADIPSPDFASLNTTGSKSQCKKRDMDSRSLADSQVTVIPQGRSRSSISARKEKLNGRPSSTTDYNENSGVRKRNSENDNAKLREKSRDHGDAGKSSSKKSNAEQKSRSSAHDMTKEQSHKLEGKMAHEKGHEKSKTSCQASTAESGPQSEIPKKELGRKSKVRRGNLSRRNGNKQSKVKGKSNSSRGVSERSSMQFGMDDSREKASEKAGTSTRSITKDFGGKAPDTSGSKLRKKASGGSAGNRLCRGEGTKSSNARTSSSSQGNGNRKDRKIKEDSVSVSSSKTAVTARRRKKRSTGLSQKSNVTNFRDESCDFNFQ